MQKQTGKKAANNAAPYEIEAIGAPEEGLYMRNTQESIDNAAPYVDEVRYIHEIEAIGAPEEGLYMLYLRIQAAYINMRVLLAGPMIKSVAEQQQIIRANQMADAMTEHTQRLANGE